MLAVTEWLTTQLSLTPGGLSQTGNSLNIHMRTMQLIAIMQLQFSRAVPIKWTCVRAQSLNHVPLFETPWTVAHQAPLSVALFRQKYWSRLPFPFPGDLPDPGIELESPEYLALAGRFFTTEPPGKC